VVQDFANQTSDLHVSFCGPAPMRRQLKKDFTGLGVSRRRFHYEEFEIRSGIGFRLFLAKIGAYQITRPAKA